MFQWLRKLTHNLLRHLWALFLNGLLTILPLTLTIALFHLTIKLIVGWLEPLRTLIPPQYLDIVPYTEVLLIIVAIFLIGTILKVFVLRTIIHTLEDIIIKIPLIRPIYSGIKQLIQAFSIQDKITFKQVVLVEFPRKGLHSVGFLTSELAQEIAPHNNNTFYNIFIPTTPNPTSGYFVIVPESDIQILSITRQEAMAMIISGGIIQPEHLIKKEPSI